MEKVISDSYPKYSGSPNKIPEYAKNYKREYQFIIGINKEFKYLKDFMDNCDNNFKSHKLDRIMKFIKIFLRAQENGRLKDISNFEFDYFHINNIYEIKRDIIIILLFKIIMIGVKVLMMKV